MVMSKKDKETIIAMGDQIRQECQKLGYSCAVGVALQSEGTNMDDLIRIADQKMYRDKTIQKARLKSKEQEEQ